VSAKILLLEDNADISDLVTLLLRGDGFDVATFSAGETAIAAAPLFQPDLLVLDIHLPGLDGVDVLKQLRLMEQFQKTPAVALTADAKRESRKRFLDAGFTMVIEKPIVDLEQFSNSLRRLTESNHVNGGLQE
jgi:CheY-like chemotaxis protein